MTDEEVFFEKTSKSVRALSYQIKQYLMDIYLSNETLRGECKDDFSNDVISRNLYKVDLILSKFLAATDTPDLEKESVEISSFMNKIRMIFNNKIEQHGVIVSEESIQGESIFADEQKLQDSLVNIVANSFEALPKKNGEINIKASKNGKYIEIDIYDNGKGINGKDTSCVFDPFFSTKEGHLGLSLTFSKNIIMAHNGNISVESSKKKGTLVKIKIPLEKD